MKNFNLFNKSTHVMKKSIIYQIYKIKFYAIVNAIKYSDAVLQILHTTLIVVYFTLLEVVTQTFVKNHLNHCF